MVSRNQLLGYGSPVLDVEKVEIDPTDMQPMLMFHDSAMSGVLVNTKAKHRKLVEAGWKDHPGKVKMLPGHEKIWEEEQAKNKIVHEPVQVAAPVPPAPEPPPPIVEPDLPPAPVEKVEEVNWDLLDKQPSQKVKKRPSSKTKGKK